MLHAVAMPIANLGDRPMTHKVEMVGQHSPEQHAKMMQSDHHESEDYCPDNNYSCCIAMALQPASPSPLKLVRSDETYTSPSLHPPRLSSDALYKPPKFYPVLAR